MKKIILIIISIFLIIGCSKSESKELKMYNAYVKELKNIEESNTDIPFEINIKVNKLENNILSYTALLDRKNITMKNIEALLIHDKKTENSFPSIGIFEETITLDENNKEKGIKLTGYLNNDNTNITFKFMIKYTDNEEKEHKYYLIYNYRQ